MKHKLLAAGAMVLALGFATPAGAAETLFWLSGAGISASGSFTFTPDTIAGDPVGANNISNITGVFSDSNPGVMIEGATITSLVPTSPNLSNAPFATSLTRVAVNANGLLPSHDNNSLTFSNLFYLYSAPDTCFDGITGGYLDVFGMLFTLSNGDEVNVWSNGNGPNFSDIYGVAVAAPVGDPTYQAIDYISSGVTMNTPEPGSFWLLGGALLGILALRRCSPYPTLTTRTA